MGSRSLLRHACPLCPTEVPRNLLMCGRHWGMVPANLRSAVWRAYDHGRGIGSRSLRLAQVAAITAVREQLAERLGEQAGDA
jgi:hypothetical protein